MTRTSFIALLLMTIGAALVVSTPAALAQAPSAISAEDKQKAIGHYRKGRQLFAAKRYEPALKELDASLALMPSPNTELLRAHALRELGRGAEAMRAYENVMNEATERLGLGQNRYQAALDDASQWFGKLRPDVAELRVLVTHAPGEVSMAYEGDDLEVAAVDASQGAFRSKAWLSPGSGTVTVRWGDGEERTAQVELAAGKVEQLELDLAPPTDEVTPEPTQPPLPDTPEPEEGEFPMPPLASWISAGVGVVGFGMFAIFGAMSASTAADLDECAPQCPDDLREDADSGKTQQTVANVGLVLGIVGLTAAGTIWLVDVLLDDGEAPADDALPDDSAVGLSVGPTGVLVYGAF